MDSIHNALQIYELLEIILLSLPPTDITRSMRVCKTWHKIILESSRLREARILRHLPSSGTVNGGIQVADTRFPHYPVTAGMRLNPVFGSDCDYFDNGEVCMTRLFIYLPNAATLRAAGEEFATFPPCTAITLETYGRSRSCTVYVRAGIRIMDLLTEMLCGSGDEDVASERRGSRVFWTARCAIGKLVGCSTA